MALGYAFRLPQTLQDLRDWADALNRILVPHTDLTDRVKTSASTVANTTTETEVYAATITARTLTVGKVVRAFVRGRYSTANILDTVTVRFKLGGTTVLSVVSTAASVTNAPLDLEFGFTTRTVGASGTVIACVAGQINNVGKAASASATTTVDTTTDLALSVTVEWSAANAGDTVTIEQGWTEYLGI